jgi:glycosyltransferase involved in cell wall biosynthesis
VLVPDADQEERDEAVEAGVTLVTPDPIPGIMGNQRLLLRPRFTEDDFVPDVVVGHGHVLGPYAQAVQTQFFPKAKRLHCVHMDAERLEHVKEPRPGRSAVTTAEQRRNLEAELAVSADLVAGIGPLLYEMIGDAMRGFRGPIPPVLELRPGLRDWGGFVDPEDPPKRRQVLLIARGEDVRSKGIDVAALAVADAVGRAENDRADGPTLVVRGVPEDDADEAQRRLRAIVEPQTSVVARPYTTDIEALRRDLWQSSLVVMPSRNEGFGLVALEAVAAGVPVLVSQESGIGIMFKELLTDEERRVPREVLPVTGEESEIVGIWSTAIHERLAAPREAFLRAGAVREQLGRTLDWPGEAERLVKSLGLKTFPPDARGHVATED